jgi:hypothetical protein
MVAKAGEDAGQLHKRHLGPGAGDQQAGELADQPHQAAHHHDGADGEQQQGVVGLVVLQLGAGQALALGLLRPHYSLLPHGKRCGSEQTPGRRRRERCSVAVLFLFSKQERVLGVSSS